MTLRLRCLPLLLALPFAVQANEVPKDAPTTVLDTVVVSGRVPGPGLWKVSKGEHVMWLLGTISPLPKRMEWASEEVEATVAASQELLMPPSGNLRVKGAAFGGLFLIPSLLKARNNPDGKKLVDVLPADDYARWARLKQQYMGRDRGVEKRRPIIASSDLQAEALDDSDLSNENVAARVASKVAKKHDVPITTPTIELVIPDAKQAVKEFQTTSLDDLDCFRRTLDRVENDIESMKLRANAWALGEIDILVSLPYTDNFRSCIDAIFENQFAKERGLGNLEQRIEETWLAAADAALEKNASTFAILPMAVMLRENGALSKLKARGYTVEAPNERAEAEDTEQTAPP
jgi:uncharacterized protein YbaP (TraB family)